MTHRALEMVSKKPIIPTLALAVAMSSIGIFDARATITPTRVLGGRTDQYGPGANTGWLGYTANTTGSPKHYDAYVKSRSTDDSPIKLNTGSQGEFGGFEPGTNVAIYRQWNNNGSRLHLIDLTDPAHPIRSSPGTAINDDRFWNFGASISTSWILYGRWRYVEGRLYEQLVLYDRVSTLRQVLTQVRGSSDSIIFPGKVTDGYATWTKYGNSIDAHYYDITNEVKGTVPNPNDRASYAPSVSDTSGRLYFARSGRSCGANVKILAWEIGTSIPFETVSLIPDGFDLTTTSTFVHSGHDDVFFDRLRCSGSYYSDIFEIPSAESP
jgi:hypothetical protein